MSGTDPFDLLRQADPCPDPRGLEAPESIVDAVLARPRRRARSRAGWVVAVVAVGAAAAAAAFVSTREPAHTASVGCYGDTRLDADTAVVGLDGRTPAEACAAVWREGGVGRGPVPPLQACTLPSGGIGVFPGGSPAVCQRLGQDAAPVPSPSTTGGVADLQRALAAAGSSTSCLEPDAARQAARAELDRRGLRDWRVDPGGGATGSGFDGERPCASFAVDEPARTVVLVPVPPR